MAITVGVSLDPENSTVTVYIDAAEFELKSQEEVDAAKKSIDAVFTAINLSSVFSSKKRADT